MSYNIEIKIDCACQSTEVGLWNIDSWKGQQILVTEGTSELPSVLRKAIRSGKHKINIDKLGLTKI